MSTGNSLGSLVFVLFMLASPMTTMGPECEGGDYLVPQFQAVPAGWKHSLWICQRPMEHRARVGTLACPSLHFSDASLSVRLTRNSRDVLHNECADNFVALGVDRARVAAVTMSVDSSLRSVGLRTHGL